MANNGGKPKIIYWTDLKLDGDYLKSDNFQDLFCFQIKLPWYFEEFHHSKNPENSEPLE